MKVELTSSKLQQAWHDFVAQAQPPEWVRRMSAYYRETGAYRPEDLRRLLGDPLKGVEVGPNAASIASLLSSKQSRAG